MGERERRIARNETTFRDANEDLRETWGELAIAETQEALFVCECGDPRCTRIMHLTLADYERIRSDSNTFAVLPGHDDPSTEHVADADVIESSERFTIVKKRPEYRSVTEATDPRRS